MFVCLYLFYAKPLANRTYYQPCVADPSKGSLAPCLVAARAVRWRPRLAGTQQYYRQI